MRCKTLFLIFALALFGVLAAGSALADCPDKVNCYANLDGGPHSGMTKVGSIHVPTCYKFGKGCRPWHCSGAKDTNREYWTNRCISEFSNCTKDNSCVAKFPGSVNQ